MKVGTKSILFGAHAFWLHPWFVALAWWKLFGFPWDPRLWVAFFVHDLGYWGKPNMDGKLGELHPFWGARVMAHLFDRGEECRFSYTKRICRCGYLNEAAPGTRWSRFVLFHSRFLAKEFVEHPSRLCTADKLAIVLTPWWLYLPLVTLSGELSEYMSRSTEGGKYASMHLSDVSARVWYLQVQAYLRNYVNAHKDGGPDTMTPSR